MLTDSTQKYLCKVEGLYDQKQCMSFATVLCLIPENVLRAPVKITVFVMVNGLAAGWQLFHRKIYGYFYRVGLFSKYTKNVNTV